MSFSGSVSRESHEGGLLVTFEGRAPGLYTGIRIVGGKFLGRVDSVIGPVNNAYIHIKPLADDLVIEKTIGSPVEIAPRDRRPRNDRGRKKSDSNPNLKPGDWVCPNWPRILTRKKAGYVPSVKTTTMQINNFVIVQNVMRKSQVTIKEETKEVMKRI